MSQRVEFWALAAAFCLATVSCSKSDDSHAKAGGGGSSGGTAAGGSGGGGVNVGGSSNAGAAGKPSTDGPAITSAPPAWVRPANCMGIGNACPNLSGCEQGSTCQSVGDVCIPSLAPGATSLPSKSMERPYCAAFTCMTFDEASCFCTGDGGKKDPRCASPEALAGLCQGQGITCGADSKCCNGLACVSHGGFSVCETPCQAATDCESGCCTDRYDTGSMICAPQSACDNPCKKRAEACDPGSATMASNCCRGDCVVSQEPDFAGCRPGCQKNEDCDTGCCSPYANSDRGFCVDAKYCGCLQAGAACGGRIECCSGTSCSGKDPDFKCNPICTQNSDCPSNCCVSITGTNTKVCETADHCAPPPQP